VSETALRESLTSQLGDAVRSLTSVAGGDINDAWRAELAGGRRVFVKSRSGASRADFESEAAGLRWLAADGGPVPGVVAVGADPAWLALEWIDRGALSREGAEELGRGLAALHAAGAGAHGELPPGSPDATLRIGSVDVEMAPASSWADLYADRLLAPLTRRAVDAGALSRADANAVDRACVRMEELVGPPEAPARLHGDLWGGNVLADSSGRGWLIDPAAYGGHREVDLAMLRLFGAPSERIFTAYAEAFPLADGHAERVALWQLCPLLVHAILFGGGYGASVGAAARRYL
jgi:fructosamine-3-kinase